MQWCAPASLQDETLIPQLPGLLDADSSHLSLPQELASAFKVHLDKVTYGMTFWLEHTSLGPLPSMPGP